MKLFLQLSTGRRAATHELDMRLAFSAQLSSSFLLEMDEYTKQAFRKREVKARWRL
jgi:Arc/MetJ family transcription regulator